MTSTPLPSRMFVVFGAAERDHASRFGHFSSGVLASVWASPGVVPISDTDLISPSGARSFKRLTLLAP